MTEELSIHEKWVKLMDELGLVNTTWGSKSAYDPNIPFSHYDINSYSIDKFKDGSEKIYERIERVSDKFLWVDEVLTDWGYSFVPKEPVEKKSFSLDEGFEWQHPNWNLGKIAINHNRFHKDMFQIKYIFGYSDTWTTIKTKEEMKSFLDKCIIWQIKRSNDTQLLREVKLKERLNA